MEIFLTQLAANFVKASKKRLLVRHSLYMAVLLVGYAVGVIFVPSVAYAAWSVSNAIPQPNTFSFSAQDGLPRDVQFKTDGTKMYILGGVSNSVYEYSLSKAWSPTSASFVQSFSVAGEETAVSAMFFRPDGTKMYVIGSTGQDVNEYTLSSPWDVSSAVFVQLFSIASEESVPQGLFFRDDGLKMYVAGSTGDDVNEYTLSSAWNISTAVFTRVSTQITQDTVPTGLFFKPDGTKLFVLGGGSDVLREYNLTTPWNVSSVTFVKQFSVAGQETGPQGLSFKDDGTKMYLVGSAGVDVNEYILSSGFVKPQNNLGLVGYWSFNEATSTQATDFSGNGNHGSLLTFADPATAVSGWTQNGKRGPALQFDGASDEVTTADINATEGVQAMTISVWIKADTLVNFANIVTKFNTTNGWTFQTGGSGAGGSNDMVFYPDTGGSGDGVFTNADSHVAGVWEHWVMRFDGTVVDDLDSIDFFKDGTEITTESQTAAIGNTTDSNTALVSIGGDNTIGGPDNEFDGAIDEVRVYNRALSDSEIRALYGTGGGAVRVSNSSKVLQQGTTLGSGLVGHWTFDGGDTRWTSPTAGVAYDRSATGAIGTLTGMNRSTDAGIGKLGQALQFDEIDNYVLVPDNASHRFGAAQDFSVAAWVRARPIGGSYAGVVGRKLSRATNRLGYLISHENGLARFYISDGVDEVFMDSTTVIDDYEWHHVLTTVSRLGNATLYVDGVAEGAPQSVSAVGDIDGGGVDLTIGDIGFTGQPFNGLIDDVRVYNRVLTSSEAKQLFNLGQLRIRQ